MSDPNAKPAAAQPDSPPPTAPPAPDIAARAAAAEPLREGKPGAKPATAPGPARVGMPAGPARPNASPVSNAASPPSSHTAPTSRRAGAVLTALAVALLLGGLAWVWSEQQHAARTAVAPADVAALREQLRTLQQRLAQVEQRPAPAAVTPVDLRPLEARIAALEQRPAAPAAPDRAIADRLGALDQRVAQAERAASQAGQDAIARAARLARLQAAAAALEAGRPLGEIPNAPAALARFAATEPPTEAALRLGFPEAAQRARAASRTADADQGVGERIWQRVRNLVTIREGDTVLLGAPATTVLAQAQSRLTAGDLAGAVAALDGLDAEAAAAIAAWRGRAEALLAARAALAGMLAA